jgi:hypothetical protein
MWRVARGPVLIGVLVLAAAIVISLVSGGNNNAALDPDSVGPTGGRAVARVLAGYGVQVERADSLAAAHDAVTGNATLLITQPNWVAPEQLAGLRARARATVAIGATGRALPALVSGARPGEEIGIERREPGCDLPVARAAGAVDIGGVAYVAEVRCYDGALVQLDGVTLLGDARPLTNEVLDEEGNAALVLRLLGQHERLVWYMPSLSDRDSADSGGGDQSFYDLVPVGWWFGLGQVVVAVLLFMLWRARRLGPVVTEPLPVVVRAAETAEGRARLYRRAKAADHAADALRRSTVDRMIPLLGLTPDATPAAVVESVAARTGRPGAEIHAVLYGPPPDTEQALVQLADTLDVLANEVGSL